MYRLQLRKKPPHPPAEVSCTILLVQISYVFKPLPLHKIKKRLIGLRVSKKKCLRNKHRRFVIFKRFIGRCPLIYLTPHKYVTFWWAVIFLFDYYGCCWICQSIHNTFHFLRNSHVFYNKVKTLKVFVRRD